MKKLPQTPGTYDEVYRLGGSSGAYQLPYRRTRYYALFKKVLDVLVRRNPQSVLEVGCGTGSLADMVMRSTSTAYAGFDFSSVAIEQARDLLGREDVFRVANALNAESYAAHQDCDVVVCTEVLEHIENDIGAMELWPEGVFCVLSVPNFDSSTHVRFFRDETEVRNRYAAIVDIESIERVKMPRLPDSHWRKVLRALWDNRRNKQRFLEILGLGDFDKVGGWFLITGTIRKSTTP